MRNYNQITGSQLTELITKSIGALIEGLQKVGFRKRITEDIDELKDTVILLSKKVDELESKINELI